MAIDDADIEARIITLSNEMQTSNVRLRTLREYLISLDSIRQLSNRDGTKIDIKDRATGDVISSARRLNVYNAVKAKMDTFLS